VKASEITFESMLRYAAGNERLAFATSYLQVEYGVSELRASWDGFVHTSNNYGLDFDNRKVVCEEFSNALNEYLEYLGEPISIKVGP